MNEPHKKTHPHELAQENSPNTIEELHLYHPIFEIIESEERATRHFAKGEFCSIPPHNPGAPLVVAVHVVPCVLSQVLPDLTGKRIAGTFVDDLPHKSVNLLLGACAHLASFWVYMTRSDVRMSLTSQDKFKTRKRSKEKRKN